ncbi:hypothetical protein PPL_03758 [Heterostelium album PN500]|uniref:CBS domain-containing protein n=1 Tax=Heterostelium pallidum (strain ATCC 26659 / Pp 5 / PN500) TaxID=670386 RepID=D3B6L0_HETP5|nr:hypothetical protein PPL_03758 [Heterostelium album PN500]EFA82980.1 hypothetical protein PPL_03758 [Heterostelium album PN500]|eukprot:XP_020435097.1 hypothetical protein PPL_03758 [Heterostelium album PN500]
MTKNTTSTKRTRKHENEEKSRDKQFDDFILSLTKNSISSFEHTGINKKRRVLDGQLASKREIVVTHKDESLHSIFNKLLNNNILSCPVLKQGELFYGMIDLLDILKFIVDEVGKSNVDKLKNDQQIINRHLKKITSLFDLEEFKTTKLSPGTTMFSAFEVLSKQGINRIAVVDDRDEIIDIITEFDLIHWVYENCDRLGSRRYRKVGDMSAANQYVMSVLEDEQVIDAFKLIKIMGVGGVAVIKEDGTLVGNLSSRDIKKIGKNGENWKRMFQPVFEFIDREPITCSVESSLEDILEIFVSKSVHRVYIVDNMFKTQGVITLRDLIGELMPMSNHPNLLIFEGDLSKPYLQVEADEVEQSSSNKPLTADQ